MEPNKITPDDALRAFSAEVSAGSGHPPAEDLLAYQEGRLAAEDRERLQAHLAACSVCARTVLDLASFPDVAPDPGRTPEDEADDWREIERRLDAAEGRQDGARIVPFPRPEEPLRHDATFRLSRGLQVLAAVLAVAVVGLSYRLYDLSREPVAAANVHFAELEPVGESHRRTEEIATRVAVPAGMRSVLLFLEIRDFRDFAGYELALTGEEVDWHHRDLVRGPEGGFTFELSRSALEPGTYRVEIHGVEGEDRELLATYRFVLEYPRE